MRANPHAELHDGTRHLDVVIREVSGQERDQWWQRCVEVFPDYADYQTKTDRQIPVLVAESA